MITAEMRAQMRRLVLVDGWRKHLEDLKTRERRSDWNEEDEEFFELHRRYIEQDPKLHARWEKVIFGKPIECTDFFEGSFPNGNAGANNYGSLMKGWPRR